MTLDNTSDRPGLGRRSMLAIGLLSSLFCAALSGCNYIVALGYLIGGPPSIEPDYETMTSKSLTDKGVVVAVVCYAPKEVLYDFSRIDREVARLVSYRLHDHKVKVIQPDVVFKWLDENPDYDEAEELGKGVGATHVVAIDIASFSIYEENTHELYRGRSEGMVTVYEVDKEGDVYSKELQSRFPLAVPRSTYDISRQAFLTQYLYRMSEEIGRLFYEHYNGDDISDAT